MPPVSQLRGDVAALVTLALSDLDGLWSQVGTLEQAREALRDVLPELYGAYGAAAATVAADWYDDLRDEVAAAGRFTAIPAELREPGTDELARWGVSPLLGENPDWDAARSLVAGGLQRRIADVGRRTVMGSAVADPGADGWQRVASGGGCSFCSMLAGRGAVYTEETVDFASHDHCRCTTAVAWKSRPRPVRPYTPSARYNRADQERAREWIAANL